MVEIPENGNNNCVPFGIVGDSAIGMGGRIDGLLVCSSCRGLIVYDMIDSLWRHLP